MEVLTDWWDDYFWGALIVAKVFAASLSLMILFGLLGAGAKLSESSIAQKIGGAYMSVAMVFDGSMFTLSDGHSGRHCTRTTCN